MRTKKKINWIGLIQKYGLTIQCGPADADEGDQTPYFSCIPFEGGYWGAGHRSVKAAIKSCCKRKNLGME